MLILSSKNDTPEIFYTLQGEGLSIGTPAIFLRTAGCNLHCFWCDTDYTWNWEGTSFTHRRDDDPTYHKFNKSERSLKISVEDCCSEILQHPCSRMVLTGGEPLLQQKELTNLMKTLNLTRSFQSEVETNGTIVPTPDFDAQIVQYNVSPKLENSQNPKSLRCNEEALRWFAQSPKASFKFVLSDPSDVEEILELVAEFNIPKSRVLWMPEGGTVEQLNKNAVWLTELCQKHGIRFSDRLHIRLKIL